MLTGSFCAPIEILTHLPSLQVQARRLVHIKYLDRVVHHMPDTGLHVSLLTQKIVAEDNPRRNACVELAHLWTAVRYESASLDTRHRLDPHPAFAVLRLAMDTFQTMALNAPEHSCAS